MRYTIECDAKTDFVWVGASDDALRHGMQFNVKDWRQFRYPSIAHTAIQEEMKAFPVKLPDWIAEAVLQFVWSREQEASE